MLLIDFFFASDQTEKLAVLNALVDRRYKPVES